METNFHPREPDNEGYRRGTTLGKFVESSEHLREIKKSMVKPGDCLMIQTQNSAYRIYILADGHVEVSGGWFDRKGMSPFKTRINGCTWGSRVIKTDILAACGMSIEFHKRIVTSPVLSIAYIPFFTSN